MTNAGKIEEATPRPWKFSPWHVEEGCSAVRAPAGHIVCTTASDADAKYIARAVNAHPNLLSVLKQIEDFSSDPTSVSLARAAREYVGALP
jgi:hypothetical protein